MKKIFCVMMVGLALSFTIASARELPGDSKSPLSPAGTSEFRYCNLWNINDIAGWIWNDGKSAHDPTDDSGVFYPRGTVGVIYQDGLIWGGIVRDVRNPQSMKMRVGGQSRRIGTTPGHIVTAGTPTTPPVGSSPNDAWVYRVRPDWAALTISDPEIRRDAAEFNQVPINDVTDPMAQEIIDQYALDWQEWPANLGAPYVDVDHNGVYNPNTDIAGIEGADQVIWLVCNDLDDGATTGLYGSPQIGLELQITMWGYKDAGHALRQVSFQRYVLINKSGLRIDSMFVSRWSDPDIGRYTDDFVGYDSDLQLGYAYNSDSVDVEFQAYGLTPPAAGYALLQGPIVPSPDDTANFRFHKLPGYKNLPVASFGYMSVGAPINPPPYGDYDGTLEWYNILNGFRPTADTLNPTPYTHGAGPQAGQATRFPLNGDPLLGTGDIDGAGNNFSPGDRQLALCSGPFTMMPGDVQEIVLMIGAGITDDYLTAINALKSYVPAAREMYESLIQAPAVGIADPAPLAAAFELEQNYPNPFNPVTVIGYQLSVVSEVRLVVYNLLGQAIRTLVDARQAPGAYEVQWDGRDGQGMALGSGIYFYRLKVGNLVESRKMVLLK